MRLPAVALRVAAKCLLPIARRAARSYIAGERLDDAVRVASRLTQRGLGVCLGYWDAEGELSRLVADEYLAGIDALVGHEHAYLSIKMPAIKFSQELLTEVVEHATRHKVRLHFDSHGTDAAEKSRVLVDQLLESGAELSYTLPGRWARSIDDAAWAAERQMVVRVVKGQWADPLDPTRDLRQGFLNVIDALAGRARHVAVASHDVPLVAEAVDRLRRTGTSCEMELLYGLPMRESLRLADRLALGVHVYVPYGKSYLPYAMSRLGSNPRMAWWLLRDFFAAPFSRRRADCPTHESRQELAGSNRD